MYYLLFVLLVGSGALSAWRGYNTGRRSRLYGGAGLVLASILFFALLPFWGELLWFDSVGYPDRFWRMVADWVGSVALGLVISLGLMAVLTRRLPSTGYPVRGIVLIGVGVFGAAWGSGVWDELFLFLYGVETSVADPILGVNTGFYLFTLPLLDKLYTLLLVISAAGAAAAAVTVWDRQETDAGIWRPLLINGLVLAGVLAAGKLLDLFHLLYSDWGVVSGPGWTDVYVRIPAYITVALLTLLFALAPLFPAIRNRVSARLSTFGGPGMPAAKSAVLMAWAAIAGLWGLALFAIPAMVQWLVVEPNEITFERPFIANNIEFTRRGFRLHEVEERQFPVTDRFTRAMASRNENVLSEVRLWDPRALDAVFKQFQEIRLYYEFFDVDIDRYTLGEEYRQVMISAREMQQENLPSQSQTFVNRRFKYTHGYGLAMAPVNEFTPGGLPQLLVKNIPPAWDYSRLALEQPRIYYGELTHDPVVANSSEPEFDYPSGEDNVYVRYSGDGGVAIDSLWRKFVFGWMFDGTRLLLSTYPSAQSRMLFHRQIAERVRTLAPFLQFDADPYVVLVNGRLKWIIDAYTTSGYYPYSEPFSSSEFIEYRNGDGRELGARVAGYLDGVNYIRNSVKAVVDAYDGSVAFYVFDEHDAIIRTWQRAFPGLFQPESAMPDELRAHVRYPEGFLLVQGLVYAKYHMEDPEVFYNQEDLWVRATEKYYGDVQPVEPYYVMWKPPGTQKLEFVLIQPFTPKNRQVLIGWIAGMCDGEDYGRFIAYQFPKQERVLGTQQVETKIDQDRFLSAQLTLWDQRGSRVIRGNVLAIPIDQTLLYVEPIYLQAETAAYPELRLVVLMHGDTLSYAEDFSTALRGLFEGGARRLPSAAGIPEREAPAPLARQAQQAFEAYLRLQAQGKFEQAAKQLRELQRLLESMVGGETGQE